MRTSAKLLAIVSTIFVSFFFVSLLILSRASFMQTHQSTDPVEGNGEWMDTREIGKEAQQQVQQFSLHDWLDQPVSVKLHAFYYPWYGNPQSNGRYLHWDHEVKKLSGNFETSQ